MPNDYFQFKQFTVKQDQCAMKVCTDACIFGAMVAGKLVSSENIEYNMLDIGAGTGLLSLMLAQKTKGTIDAVEIDAAAYKQAAHNFEKSPWSKRLTVFNENAMLFDPGKKYNCIISNPPFFEGDLKSNDSKKNAAKHDDGLTLESLLAVINKLLAPDGVFAVLLPVHRVHFFIEIATAAHYFLDHKILISHTSLHPYFRGILFFTNRSAVVTTDQLAIKKEDGGYTSEFEQLLSDYYLHL